MEGIFNKTLEEGNKKFPSGSSKFFTFEEGDNRIRILSVMQVFGQHYIQGAGYKFCIGLDNGCPYCKGKYKVSPTYFVWVLDRADGAIKEAKLSYTVLKSINDITAVEEYNFVPTAQGAFPYDINVRMIDGKKKGEKRSYNILPGEKSELTEEEKEEVRKLKNPMFMVEEMKTKALADEGKLVDIPEEVVEEPVVEEPVDIAEEIVIEEPRNEKGEVIKTPF